MNLINQFFGQVYFDLSNVTTNQVDHKVFYQHEDGHIDYWSNQ